MEAWRRNTLPGCMGDIHQRRISRILMVLVFCVCVCMTPSPEDESTIEIVLIDKPNRQREVDGGAGDGTDKASRTKSLGIQDRAKVLRDLLATLASRLAASSKLKNRLLEGGQDNRVEAVGVENNTTDTANNTPRPDVNTLNKIDRIPMSYEVFCSFLQNLDLIRNKLKNRPGIGRIRGVLIYESYHLTDYWGRLRFKKEDDRFVDDTGYFEGIRVDKFEDVLKQGKMTETGFVQKKDMGSGEVNEDVMTMKLLLNEVAKEKNVPVSRVVEERCNLSIVEELAFYGNSPSAHNNETVHVCICTDSFCKDPCKEVIPMKKGEIKFKG